MEKLIKIDKTLKLLKSLGKWTKKGKIKEIIKKKGIFLGNWLKSIKFEENLENLQYFGKKTGSFGKIDIN